MEDFRQGGTVDWERETPASWSFSTRPETPSGPAAFLWFTARGAPHLALLHCEGEAAIGCRVMCGCVWLLRLQAGKEEVQLLCQRGVPFSSPEAGPVVGGALESLPHQVVFSPPPVV